MKKETNPTEKQKTEKIWEEFLNEYFKNVKRKLPESYRARQLEAGGLEAGLVIEFETKFLKKPFMKAMKEATVETKCKLCNKDRSHVSLQNNKFRGKKCIYNLFVCEKCKSIVGKLIPLNKEEW